MRGLPSQRLSGIKALIGVAAFLPLSCLLAVAGKDFVMPTAQAAHTYPAHDDHPTEKVTIAVDPYDTADKAATAFNVKYRDEELLLLTH